MGRGRPPPEALLPCAVLVVLLLALVGSTPPLLRLMHANSDLSAPLVMGDVAHRYDDAQLVTGRLGWWGPLWVVQALRAVPGGLWLADWLPIAATAAIAGLVAWQARRVWSDVSALIVALVALSAGQAAWTYNASWSARGPSWVAMGLMGLAVVRMAGRRRLDMGTGALAGAALLAVAVTGSGDQLALVGGGAPLVAAAVVATRRRRRWWLAERLVVGAGATYGLSVAAAAIADSTGYLRQDLAIKLIKLDKLGAAFDGLVDATQQVWTSPAGIGSAAGEAGVAIVAVAVLAGVGIFLARLVRPGEDAAGDVWVAFWLTALIGYLAAFWLTTAAGEAGANAARYLYGVPLAAGATLAPLGSFRLTRWPAGVAAAALAALTAGALLARPPQLGPASADLSRSTQFAAIERVADREQVTRGFASYWAAYPLVLHSDRRLDVTPAGTCTLDGRLEICAMYLHYVDQAYAQRRGIRSFLLVDESGLAGAGFSAAWVQRLPASLHPVKVVPIGDGIEMAIFDHDVAADIHPNGGQGDPRAEHGGPLEPTV